MNETFNSHRVPILAVVGIAAMLGAGAIGGVAGQATVQPQVTAAQRQAATYKQRLADKTTAYNKCHEAYRLAHSAGAELGDALNDFSIATSTYVTEGSLSNLQALGEAAKKHGDSVQAARLELIAAEDGGC